MKNESTATVLYGFRHFNELVLFGRKCNDRFGHIKKLKSERTNKHNIILRMVISNMRTMDWTDFYGLNISETMELEFADYMFMVDELHVHAEEIVKKKQQYLNSTLSGLGVNNG